MNEQTKQVPTDDKSKKDELIYDYLDQFISDPSILQSLRG